MKQFLLTTLLTLFIANQGLAASLKVGESFPQFKLPKISEVGKKGGKLVSSDSLKGKIVILDFWASWCEPCKIALPNYDKLFKKYKSKGLMVVGINVDDESKLGHDFLKEHKVAFPILYDEGKKVVDSISVSTMPTSYILDKNGKIIEIHKGFRAGDETKIEQKIKELLN